MDRPANDEAADLSQFLAAGHKIKTFPGSHLPANAKYQVCSNHPCVGLANTKGVCSQCHGPVYFADNHPTLAKICTPCFLKFAQTHEVESVSNLDSLTKAGLVTRRN
jgi:hypothetical protein